MDVVLMGEDGLMGGRAGEPASRVEREEIIVACEQYSLSSNSQDKRRGG